MNWDKTVQELGPRLYRYFLGAYRKEMAEELVQEVLVRMVRGFKDGKFDPAKGSLAMWAFGVAHNVRLEASRVPVAVELVEEDALEAPTEPLHEILALRKAIQHLTGFEKDVILLLIDEDLSLPEIAKVLELPLGTVKSHVHRAKQHLRELL